MDESGKSNIGMLGNDSKDGDDGSVMCLKAPLRCIWDNEHIEKFSTMVAGSACGAA